MSEITGEVIPASVTAIEQLAFSYCTGIEEITIPASVVSVGKYAFLGWGSGTNTQTINRPFSDEASAFIAWGGDWRKYDIYALSPWH